VRAPLLLGFVVVGLFLGLMLWATEGHFVAQVSDLYVVAQYARAFAEGHPFRYHAGEAPTSGSTSLLHTALLAGAERAGARGEGLIAVAVVLGALFYLASIVLAGRVAARLAGARESALAAALVALCGPVVWGYLYGSDIALFLLLALLLLERWLAFWEGGSVKSVAVAGGLLALARPEGLPIAVLLAVAASLHRGARRAERLWLLAPVAAGLSVLLLQRVVTGTWLATSVAEKALLPNYGPVQGLMAASRYGVDVLRGLLLGLYPPEARIGFSRGEASFVFPPLALLLILLALSQTGKAAAVPARLWLAVIAIVFALTGPNVFMGVHFNRYLMWAFPGLIAFAAAGVGVLTRLAARDDALLERNLFRGAAGLLLVLGALSTAHFAGVYAALAGETWRREIPMAAFIREQLPRGVAIANVATSIEYLTGHRNLNPHGVTSPGFAGGRTLEREASMFESLSRIEPAARPPYIMLTRSSREASPLLQALAPDPALFATSSFSDDLVLHRASWGLLDGGDELVVEASRRAVAGLQRTDRLDVCDPADEAAHGYRVETRRGDLVIGGAVAIGPVSADPAALPLADAGRVVIGRERFRVGTRPGRDLVIVLRTRSEAVATFMRADGGAAVELSMPEAGIVVAAGGRDVGRFVLRNAPGWNEHVLRVPAAAVAEGDATVLELRGRYAAFHYWFYQ
jgi:hypothetical protein